MPKPHPPLSIVSIFALSAHKSFVYMLISLVNGLLILESLKPMLLHEFDLTCPVMLTLFSSCRFCESAHSPVY